MPIYKVITNVADGGHKSEKRLVRAATKATAKNFAADKHIAVEQASDDDLIALTKEGIEVENADIT